LFVSFVRCVAGLTRNRGRGGSTTAARVLGWLRVDPAQVAVLLEQPQGGFEVGGLGEAAAGGGPVGISAAELAAAGAVDPFRSQRASSVRGSVPIRSNTARARSMR
jgi:hypothetical protein